MRKLTFCSLFDIFVLRSREVVSHLPGLPIKSFGYEEVTSLLSRQSSVEEMSKILYYTLLLISLCFLALRLQKHVTFKGVKFSSQNIL